MFVDAINTDISVFKLYFKGSAYAILSYPLHLQYDKKKTEQRTGAKCLDVRCSVLDVGK